MGKTAKKVNLLKKQNLIDFMKKQNITRINPQALEFFDKQITKEIEHLTRASKQNMNINARKTLIKQDVIDVLESRENKENWDI